MSLYELARYRKDENYEGKTYISIKGRIFDISEHELFQPAAKYFKLAGTEAGIALAKSDISDKWINSMDTTILTNTEKKFLNQHYLHFSNDFEVVGYLQEWIDKNGLEAKAKDPSLEKKDKPKRVLGLDTRKSKSDLEQFEKIALEPVEKPKVEKKTEKVQEMEPMETKPSLKNRKKNKK